MCDGITGQSTHEAGMQGNNIRYNTCPCVRGMILSLMLQHKNGNMHLHQSQSQASPGVSPSEITTTVLSGGCSTECRMKQHTGSWSHCTHCSLADIAKQKMRKAGHTAPNNKQGLERPIAVALQSPPCTSMASMTSPDSNSMSSQVS